MPNVQSIRPGGMQEEGLHPLVKLVSKQLGAHQSNVLCGGAPQGDFRRGL